jgi:heme-degrading monooxygenase HmoA
MTHIILWTYEVAPEHETAFAAAYGADGDWARLFGRAEGFVGVELYRHGPLFLSIDRWLSRLAFEAFQERFAADYASLDAKLAPLSQNQRRLGAFDQS